MAKNNSILLEDRLSALIYEINMVKPDSFERLIWHVADSIKRQVLLTNKCYRLPLFELVGRDILLDDEVMEFKSSLINILTNFGLRAEEEQEDILKIECFSKMKKEELPVLNELQKKLIALSKVDPFKYEAMVQKVVSNNKLSQLELKALNIVLHYEE